MAVSTDALYPEMLAACMLALHDGERMSINANLLNKIVQICAGVAVAVHEYGTTDPEPPETVFIKASVLRPGDLVWRPDCRFEGVESVLVDLGAVQVTFDDDEGLFNRDESVRVCTDRERAHAWNLRRALLDPEAVDRLLNKHAPRP